MNNITVLVANPGEDIMKREIPNTLAALQELVGGHIETITLPAGQILIVNEEGAIKGMPLNRLVRTFDRILALHGPIVLVRAADDHITSVSRHDWAWMQYNSKKV